MRTLMQPRYRHAEAERALRLIETLTAERDAAYAAGWDAGYSQGLEDGLRALLDDARLALGRAA